MFATVLHNLKGPRNVGQIIRSHVAYGGGPLLFVGHDEPWKFRASTSRYSRKLEKHCDIGHLPGSQLIVIQCRPETRAALDARDGVAPNLGPQPEPEPARASSPTFPDAGASGIVDVVSATKPGNE